MDRNRGEMLMLLTGSPSRGNDAEGRLIPFFLAYGWTAAMDLRLWRFRTATVERCFTPAGTATVRIGPPFPLNAITQWAPQS